MTIKELTRIWLNFSTFKPVYVYRGIHGDPEKESLVFEGSYFTMPEIVRDLTVKTFGISYKSEIIICVE